MAAGRAEHDRGPAGDRSGFAAVLVGLGLALAVALTFANALSNGFVFDDDLLIVNDPAVRASLDSGWPGRSYRPLRTLSYRLDHAIGGMEPWIFHLGNVVYHGVTVLLVCAAVRATGASLWAAAAGALLFAVHPVQTDAVTYAAGRRDVLCGLFFVAGFLAWTRARRHGSALALLAALVAYVLGLLAKEMAITLPLVCLLYERWRRRASAAAATAPAAAEGGGRRLAWAVGLGVVGLVVLGVVYGGHVRRVLAETPWYGGSPAANLATVARVWVHYLGLVLWPAELSADYSFDAFPVSTSLADPWALASLAILAALGFLAALAWRRGARAGLGAAWWAVTLLPVSHLIPYRELMAEHYLYLPMVGVALVVSDGVDRLAAWAPARRRALAAAVLVVAAAAALRTVDRNRDWRDKLTLWSVTVATVPRCARAHFNLGQVYFERARLADAEREWQTALAITPDDPAVHHALAGLYHRLARHEDAARHVEAALARRPHDPETQTLAGWIALGAGDPRGAVPYFEAAMLQRPGRRGHGARLGYEAAQAALEPTPTQRLGHLPHP